MVVGNHLWCDAGWERCPLAGEGKEAVDRKSITLEQEELIKQVFAANPRTVVVLRASSLTQSTGLRSAFLPSCTPPTAARKEEMRLPTCCLATTSLEENSWMRGRKHGTSCRP